jgi:hypothetical protein
VESTLPKLSSEIKQREFTHEEGGLQMSFLEWFLLVFLMVIYVTCLFTVAAVTFRNGHWILGILGIFFPVFWLVGAVLPPTEEAVAEAVLES